jgi:Ca2+-binding EF-hand superfamily protein
MNQNISQNESDIANQSINITVYKKQIAQYYQSLLDAFKQIDKNKDEFIDEKELTEFLDSNLPKGKKFDRSLLQKIFEILDRDRDGRVSA